MEELNLTQGNIVKALVRLAIPVMGTSFVQMAYNLTDMIWIGQLGSGAVAAVGTAGFFGWLAMAFILVSMVGTGVNVAHAIGKDEINEARKFVRTGFLSNIIIITIYSLALIIFREKLISFFNLGDRNIIKMAKTYLAVVASGFIFYSSNQMFSGTLNGYGDSRTPFKINALGLIINMILDPVLIFGLGPFPRLEVLGAALATITAQFVVTLTFMWNMKDHVLFSGNKIFSRPDFERMREIIITGFPVALQEGLLATFAMGIAKIISQWGPVPIAVQKIGAQIEAISWMTASGFSTALSAFIGQNFGAKQWDRISNGYFVAMIIMGTIGVGATLLLYLAAGPIFAIFLQEKEALMGGIAYLKILSFSQFFMCTEITTAGAFNGLGKTIPPAVVGILFTGIRIPVALLISKESLLGLNGVWWSISMSSVIKGVVLPLWFLRYMKNHKVLKHHIKFHVTEF